MIRHDAYKEGMPFGGKLRIGGLRQIMRACFACLRFAAAIVLLFAASGAATANAYQPVPPPQQNWSFSGVFGVYDKAQLQRGLKIWAESCSACHSLRYVALRDLQALGYSLPQIREFAERFQYPGIDSSGQAVMRKGTVRDYFPAPYSNDTAAAIANNGVIPPDLSLMAKARAVRTPFGFITDFATHYDSGGTDYIAALLTGYQNPPADAVVPDGQYYNPYFVGGAALAMSPPLQDGLIEYNDGSPQNVKQYAQDIAAFLTWTADPHRDTRHKTGFFVCVFLAPVLVLLWLLKREVWSQKD